MGHCIDKYCDPKMPRLASTAIHVESCSLLFFFVCAGTQKGTASNFVCHHLSNTYSVFVPSFRRNSTWAYFILLYQCISLHSFTLQIKVARANFLLRNTLRVPVLELDTTNIQAGTATEAAGVTRCFAILQSSIWSYNDMHQAWEPVVEPLQMLAHLDINNNAQARGGVMPGTWIKLTSTQVRRQEYFQAMALA